MQYATRAERRAEAIRRTRVTAPRCLGSLNQWKNRQNGDQMSGGGVTVSRGRLAEMQSLGDRNDASDLGKPAFDAIKVSTYSIKGLDGYHTLPYVVVTGATPAAHKARIT